MSAGWAGIVTFAGLLLALGGVGCGAWAYITTVWAFDEAPLWPRVHQLAQRARSLIGRRPVETAMKVASQGGVASMAGSGSASLTAVRADETLEEWVARLQERLERAERNIVQDRSEVQQQVDKLSARIVEQGVRLDSADEQIRALAKSVAVSSARLQLVGLILVGLGTALMAIPAIVTAL